MIRTLLHWWRLWTQPSGEGRLMFFHERNWRVRYTDGGRSAPMCYDTACDYADLFGGVIEPFPVEGDQK